MEKQNFLDGWKTLLTTAAGAGSLALADIPEPLVWPVTAILCTAVFIFGLQGVVKAWKGGK
jgi:hypothetical protein